MKVTNQNNSLVNDEILNVISTLRSLRKSQNLTQRDIAQLTGIAYQNICRMENGGVTPTLSFLIKYMHAINSKIEIVTVDSVMKNESSE